MIKDFDLVKKQLAELSKVVNDFKSEAVQLRIVELIFGATDERDHDTEAEKVLPRQSAKRKRSRTKTQRAKTASPTAKASKPRGSGGATDVIRQLAKDGFFKTPRLIGEVVDHCRVKLAKSFKPNELSPGLGRLVRENVLDRDKDEKTKQFKYHKA